MYEDAPVGLASLFGKNATLTGGPATIRAYVRSCSRGSSTAASTPARCSTRAPLGNIAEACRLMDTREALKVLIRP